MSTISKLEMLIERVVRRVIREELSKGTPIQKEAVRETRQQPVQQNKKRVITTEKKEYTKNKMLNDILNETVHDVDDWPTMTFDSSRVAMDGTLGMMSKAPETVIPVTDLDGKRVDTSKPEMESVVAALTKDYSALMKAMDKKKGS